MDSYLEIAEIVLREERRPLTAKDLLKRAYKLRIVPANLYGKTQHKTLQARISEDILGRRDRSRFFRTAPGVFFLRDFLNDATIPPKFRSPIVARRRQRELPVKNALALNSEHLAALRLKQSQPEKSSLSTLLHAARYYYIHDSKTRRPEDSLVWAFVVLTRKKSVLAYRQGKYRESRDSFSGKRSIGFYIPISEKDNDLFDRENLGILNSSLSILCLELDIDPRVVWNELLPSACLDKLFVAQSQERVTDILALVRFECPDWLEPLTKRLSLNDIQWLDVRSQVNHIEDFDPWSELILSHLNGSIGSRGGLGCSLHGLPF
jgi:hypothetical protein